MAPDASAPVVDMTFIAAGPSGPFGVFQSSLCKMMVRVIDNRPRACGPLTALYPWTMVYDVAGHPAILAPEFKADLGPIRAWGVEAVGQRYAEVNGRMETNLAGVHAASDITSQEGVDPLNLIVVGFGQATLAVNDAYAPIKPGGKVFPGHSSERVISGH